MVPNVVPLHPMGERVRVRGHESGSACNAKPLPFVTKKRSD